MLSAVLASADKVQEESCDNQKGNSWKKCKDKQWKIFATSCSHNELVSLSEVYFTKEIMKKTIQNHLNISLEEKFKRKKKGGQAVVWRKKQNAITERLWGSCLWLTDNICLRDLSKCFL